MGKWSGRTISLIGSTDKPLGVEWKNDFVDYDEMNNQVPSIWTISRHKKRVDLHEIHKIEYSNRLTVNTAKFLTETDLNSHVVSCLLMREIPLTRSDHVTAPIELIWRSTHWKLIPRGIPHIYYTHEFSDLTPPHKHTHISRSQRHPHGNRGHHEDNIVGKDRIVPISHVNCITVCLLLLERIVLNFTHTTRH